MLWCCIWEKGQRGNNATCSALTPLLVTSPATHKWIVPFCYWFLGVCACVHSRILWAPPMDSAVRLGVSPIATTPTDFYCQRFWGFTFPTLELWVAWSVSLPSCSSQCIRTQMCDCPVCQRPSCHESSLHRLPVSIPPTSLDECFFFNSLVVGLLYSSIFWQFWFLLFFKLVVILLLVVEGSEVYLPMPPSWPELHTVKTIFKAYKIFPKFTQLIKIFSYTSKVWKTLF